MDKISYILNARTPRDKIRARNRLFDDVMHYLDHIERYSEHHTTEHHKVVDKAIKSLSGVN